MRSQTFSSPVFMKVDRALPTECLPTESWSHCLHFVIQLYSQGNLGVRLLGKRGCFFFKPFEIKACGVQALCVTLLMKKKVSQQLKENVMKMKDFDTHPTKAGSLFYTVTLSVSQCVKDRKCQG